jgi:hypothetical protein
MLQSIAQGLWVECGKEFGAIRGADDQRKLTRKAAYNISRIILLVI